jgi:membrane protease subunit HflK
VRYLLSALTLALAGYLLTGVTQVRPGERGVVRRFGRVIDITGPGLRIGLPYGMERVDRVPVDLVRRVRVGYEPEVDLEDQPAPVGQLLTGDHNLVNVQVVVDYTVNDSQVEDYVVQADRADGLLARAAESIISEWVAGRRVDDVLIRGKLELPLWLAHRLQDRIEPYGLGVQIEGASVGYLLPPEEVKPAFDEVTRAQTAVRTREHEARQEAARRLREAEAEKHRIERMSAAYVDEQLVMARSEAVAFELRLRQYKELVKLNPHFLAGIWWDEIGKLFRQMKENGRLDLLDNHLGGEGLDITVIPPLPKKK